MNEFIFMCVGSLLTVVFFGFLKMATMAPPPKKGYAITYATLEDASDAYQGVGLIVRLDIFGPEPLSLAETTHAGARYIGAIRRAKKAREKKENEVVIQYRGRSMAECPIPGCPNGRAKFKATCESHAHGSGNGKAY